MMTLTTPTKLTKIFETPILNRVATWKELLLQGDLGSFERELQSLLQELQGEIMRQLLDEVGSSLAFKNQLEKLASGFGLSRLKLRRTRLQIGTGQWIEYRSYYAHQTLAGYRRVNRQLSHMYWGCVDRASPKHLSLALMMSVVCPSFEVATQVLGE